MKEIITRIQLEMSGETNYYMLSVKQGNRKTRHVYVSLFDRGEAYNIPSGATVIVNIEKPDGKFCYNTCAYNENTVHVVLTNQALAAAGTAYADIEIDTDDGGVISSATFAIEVEKSCKNENAIMSSNEMTVIEQWMQAVRDAEANREKAEDVRDKAEHSRETGENKRDNAEQKRVEAETLRQKQEQTRQENTGQAVKNAEQATKEANTAATKANTASDRAEDALQNQAELEKTLNESTQIYQNISLMKEAVESAKNQVSQDKAEIDETIKNSLLASAEEILQSVQEYYRRAEAIYSSMVFNANGGNPYTRIAACITISGGTPQIRATNGKGIVFNGGTPGNRFILE